METGPQDFTAGELSRHGLGVVVRALKVPGSPSPETLRRLYCLPCGVAISHEPLLAKWWMCPNGCNATPGRTGAPEPRA